MYLQRVGLGERAKYCEQNTESQKDVGEEVNFISSSRSFTSFCNKNGPDWEVHDRVCSRPSYIIATIPSRSRPSVSAESSPAMTYVPAAGSIVGVKKPRTWAQTVPGPFNEHVLCRAPWYVLMALPGSKRPIGHIFPGTILRFCPRSGSRAGMPQA